MGKTIRASIKTSALAFVGVAAVAYGSSASACGDTLVPHHAGWQTEQGRSDASGLLHFADVGNPGNHAIVGMWSFKMAAQGGFSDFGYQQWHSDGTEFMNSGGRAPSTQNYCLGVWRQVAPSHYHLNHFALSYDTSGTLNAKVNIKEDVTLDPSGTTYSGPFTIDVYDPNGGLLQHVAGQVTAQRVPAN